MEKKYIYITGIVIVIIIIGAIIYFYKKNKNKETFIPKEENLEEKIKQEKENFEKMILSPPAKLEEIRKDLLQDDKKLNSFKFLVNRASELGAEWAKKEQEQNWYKNSPEPKIEEIKEEEIKEE